MPRRPTISLERSEQVRLVASPAHAEARDLVTFDQIAGTPLDIDQDVNDLPIGNSDRAIAINFGRSIDFDHRRFGDFHDIRKQQRQAGLPNGQKDPDGHSHVTGVRRKDATQYTSHNPQTPNFGCLTLTDPSEVDDGLAFFRGCLIGVLPSLAIWLLAIAAWWVLE